MELHYCSNCEVREMSMLHLATVISTIRAQAKGVNADRADPEGRPHVQFNSLVLSLVIIDRSGQCKMRCGVYVKSVWIKHSTGLDFDWTKIFLPCYPDCYCW